MAEPNVGRRRSSVQNIAKDFAKDTSQEIGKKAASQLRNTMAKYEERQRDDQLLQETSSRMKKTSMKSMRMSRSLDSLHTDHGQEQDEQWNAEERLNKAMRGGNKGYIIKYSQYVSQKDIRKLGVEKQQLVRAALDDEYQRKTAYGFPMIVLYLALFMLIFQYHYGVSFVFLQENQMRGSLVTPALDVSNAQDIFTWMSGTLIPYLWSSINVAQNYSTQWPTDHQKLVAGLIIKTTRSNASLCANERVSQFTCFDSSTNRPANDDPVFTGWRQTRRLSETDFSDFGRGIARRSSWVEKWTPGAFTTGDQLAKRKQRVQLAHQVVRDDIKKRGAKRDSIRERRRLRRLQEEAVATDERRLAVINAHMKDSVPNLNDYSNYIYQYVMPMSMPEADVQLQLSAWQEDQTRLITNTTIILTVDVMILNENMFGLNGGVLTTMGLSFIFSRGGTIFVESNLGTMLLETKSLVLFGLFAWGIILVGFTLANSLKLRTAIVHGDVCSYIMHFTNAFEWALVLGGWFIVLFIALERLDIAWFQDQWQEYERARPTIDAIRLKEFDRSWLLKLDSRIDRVVLIDDYGQIGVAFYHIALVLRILMASQGHPRLAIVVNTISQGFNDLVHLFVVFIIIFISFVMMGFILFGTRMGEFATIKGSLGYCMQIVLQRQYDNESIQEFDYFTSSMWIVSFVVLVVLVVVNVVLAMIFDNYGDVVKGITPQDTVWNTIRQRWRNFRNPGWLSNSAVIRALNKSSDKELITKGRLLQLLPLVTNEQIDSLYESVKLRLITMVAKGRKNIVPEALAAILLGVEDMREGVAMMAEAQEGPQMSPKGTSVPPSRATAERPEQPKREAEVAGVDADGAAPQKVPYWVEEGLLKHLRKRQAIMDQLFLQMQQIHSNLKRRGLGTSCDELPIEEPDQPSREGSKRLDSTLTGQYMKPMITPGQERGKPMAEEPRATIAPVGGFSMAKRLKKK